MQRQEIQLNGYAVKPAHIMLGTFDSYGLEELHITTDELWQDLAITATFNAPSGKAVTRTADAQGVIKVPPEAVEKESGEGTIVFVGVGKNAQRISRNLYYTAIDHDNTEGLNAADPTPDLVQQILAAASTAEKTAQSVRDDADNGKFTGPPGPQGETGEVETLNNLEIQEILNMLDF
jgi:hypothetical protein|nr:MAG TPA_asm: Protein mraZ Division and cell wall.7A [Caudoviricetes sp.]